jgi:hypothetical protein
MIANCQMGRCTEDSGEVRVLPLRPNDFVWDWVALCRHCFELEIKHRQHANIEIPWYSRPYHIQPWETCPLITPEQIALLERSTQTG